MTIRHLKVLDCVCRHGSITRAAEELFVAQPAVSSAIAEIERHYGVAVFTRINQRIVLTAEGREMWLKAREVLSAFGEFEDTAGSVSRRPTLRIGSTFTIGKLYVPALIKEVESSFSDATLRVTVKQAAALEEKICDGSIDVAIIEGVPVSRNVTDVTVGKDRLIIAAGAEHPIADSVTPKELCEHKFLIREQGSASAKFLRDLLFAKGLTPEVFMESASNEVLISGAVASLGIVALPEGLLRPYIDSGELREISVEGVDLCRTYHMITHKNRRFSPTCADIYELLKCKMQQMAMQA